MINSEKNSDRIISNGGKTNVTLAPYTTFHVGGPADIFYEATSVDELKNIIRKHHGERITVLGGGSNILVSDAGIRGVVIRIAIPGYTYEDTGETVRARVGAGESWDTFVEDSVTKKYSGIENLSGIPGTVGASPIQNIGAYGVEVKDTIEWVEVLNMETLEIERLGCGACAFGYRDSFFKKSEGKKYIVTQVAFLLSKKFTPNTDYKDLAVFFGDISPNSASAVREAVLSVRKKKFPDMETIGTAGSFFKNPVIPGVVFDLLRERYPKMQGYPSGEGQVKVSLAWILDHVLHLNGVVLGKVFFNSTQPLVLCAHKNATAEEIDAVAKHVEKMVYDTTGIVVAREVCMLS